MQRSNSGIVLQKLPNVCLSVFDVSPKRITAIPWKSFDYQKIALKADFKNKQVLVWIIFYLEKLIFAN